MSDATTPIPMSKQLNVPPVWMIGMLLTIWLWHSFLPIAVFGGTWSKVLGALEIVASMGLAIWSIMQFQEADTPVHPRRKPTTLLTSGPYAFSRNPIYLAMIGVGIGAALCFGSIGAFIPVIGFTWVIWDLFIAGEEHFIEKNYGEEWNSYTSKTRRWI